MNTTATASAPSKSDTECYLNTWTPSEISSCQLVKAGNLAQPFTEALFPERLHPSLH